METRKYHYDRYVQGSAARKLEAEPQRRQPGYPPEREKRRRAQQKKQQAQRLDIVSLLFMTGAVAIVLYLCVSYIEVQHNITTMSKQAAILESEISELKDLNDAAYNRVNTSVDLAYIYDMATNELGMVRAENDQVIPYENKKSDYVRQYGEIPKEEKSVLERAITKDKK